LAERATTLAASRETSSDLFMAASRRFLFTRLCKRAATLWVRVSVSDFEVSPRRPAAAG
jgi:hypothetical protein